MMSGHLHILDTVQQYRRVTHARNAYRHSKLDRMQVYSYLVLVIIHLTYTEILLRVHLICVGFNKSNYVAIILLTSYQHNIDWIQQTIE